MSLSKAQFAELRLSLQQAVLSCSQRCLYQSSKWVAALLTALPENVAADEVSSLEHVCSPFIDVLQLQLEQNEFPKYLLAKSFFDCREFQRCAAVFLPQQSNGLPNSQQGPASDKISRKALFLALYALMIAGEKQKAEQQGQILGKDDTEATVNQQLAEIKSILRTFLSEEYEDVTEHDSSQGWLEYL
jgi:anaphase-promoting complex subunit 8